MYITPTLIALCIYINSVLPFCKNILCREVFTETVLVIYLRRRCSQASHVNNILIFDMIYV